MTSPATFAAESKRPLILAEQLRQDGVIYIPTPNGTKQIAFPRETFAGCTPVVLDAVSDWWDAQGADKWPDDRLEPNYRLPWAAVWAEWEDKNEQIQAELKGRTGAAPIYKGCSLREIQLKPGKTPEDFLRGFSAQMGVMGMRPSNPLWRTASILVIAQLLMRDPVTQRVVGFPHILFPVPDDGRSPGGVDYCIVGGSADIAPIVWNDLGMWRLFTALLAVRNIGLADVDLPRAARRRNERQAAADGGPPPWVKYKTLAITLPSQRGTLSLSRADPTSSIPFHLVRGHLADYREGRGLFGKWRTIVWVPMHTRGSQSAGAIAKAYSTTLDVDADPLLPADRDPSARDDDP